MFIGVSPSGSTSDISFSCFQEIVLGKGYNSKVDVYSWAMVFYQMLDLQKPFELYNREVHRLMVCIGGQRPPLRQYWPHEIRSLLHHAWAPDTTKRLSIKQVCTRLAPLVALAELQMLSPSERSARIIYEMAGLFGPCCSSSSLPSRSNNSASIGPLVSKRKIKSATDLTASTDTLVSLPYS